MRTLTHYIYQIHSSTEMVIYILPELQMAKYNLVSIRRGTIAISLPDWC